METWSCYEYFADQRSTAIVRIFVRFHFIGKTDSLFVKQTLLVYFEKPQMTCLLSCVGILPDLRLLRWWYETFDDQINFKNFNKFNQQTYIDIFWYVIFNKFTCLFTLSDSNACWNDWHRTMFFFTARKVVRSLKNSSILKQLPEGKIVV